MNSRNLKYQLERVRSSDPENTGEVRRLKKELKKALWAEMNTGEKVFYICAIIIASLAMLWVAIEFFKSL